MVRIRVILQDTSNLNILNLPKVISSKFIDLNKFKSEKKPIKNIVSKKNLKITLTLR